jgi:cytoskeletal protein RodZ
MTKEKNTNDAIEVEAEVVEPNSTNKNESIKKEKGDHSEIFSRIFYTVLFCFIGWVTLWVFTFVVLIQFGFLLITGQVNKNLKGFNKEIGLFLYDMIKYLSFQSDIKPFPFRDWPYDEENNKNKNNSELNDSNTVEVGK